MFEKSHALFFSKVIDFPQESQILIDCAISYITTPPHGMCCPKQKVVVKGVLRKGIPRNKSA